MYVDASILTHIFAAMHPRFRRLPAILFGALFMLTLGLSASATAQTVRYVDESATATECGAPLDGSSWDCAFRSLQNGIAAAQSGDEIWVAQGTYFPDEGDAQRLGSRDEVFHVPDGVSIYGGFDGTETSRSNRNPDPATNGTVLSSDIGTTGDAADNSFTLVVLCNAGSSTTLDGLTVRGAQRALLLGGTNTQKRSARESIGCDYRGDGWEVQDSGGIWISGGAPVIRNVISTNNTSDFGGGITIVDGAEPTLQSVTLSDNLGRSNGGGLLCDSSAPVVIDVTVRDNIAGDSFPGLGAGIFLTDCDGRYERLILSRNFADENTDGGGGGAWIEGGAPVLTDIDIFDNGAGLQGGGLFLRSSNATIIGADIRANETVYNVPAMSIDGGAPFIANAVISGHAADAIGLGGSVLVEGGATPTFLHLTLTGNNGSAHDDLTGGMLVREGSSVTLQNSIVWGNYASSRGQLVAEGTSTITVEHAIVEGGYPGTAVRDADPLFTDPRSFTSAPTREGTYTLTKGSAALDRGNASFLPPDTYDLDNDGDTTEPLPIDLNGDARLEDNDTDGTDEYDLGAYEAPSSVQPVRLAGFSARANGARAVLSWSTLSETGNAGFEIEQKRGPAWTRVGEVDGAGTSAQRNDYQFETEVLAPGVHQFRLRQVDVDGTETIAGTVQTRITPDDITLTSPSPHPVKGRTTVELTARSEQPVRVELYDGLGRRVQTLHDGPVRAGAPLAVTVEADGLASGTYWIRATGETFSTTQRIVVVR